MPPVKPFRGLLYAPGRVPIAKVVTEPYDKITPGMQRQYYHRHPSNFVRLILGKEGANRYRLAAERLDTWIDKGILRSDPVPAFYLYEQIFNVPSMGIRKREGIIGLLKLEDFSKGNVLPHEHTLAKPRRDRLNLLRATRANLEQIFLLYEDPQKRLEKKCSGLRKKKPILDFCDDSGVRQRLWRIADEPGKALISGVLGRRKFFIADGHHRYTISLHFHRQVLARRVPTKLKANSAWRMATFVNMHSTGLVILPTHRALSLSGSWKLEPFLEDLRRDFEIRNFPMRGGLMAATRRLALSIRKKRRKDTVFGLVTKTKLAILKLRNKPDIRERWNALEKPFRDLDVAILHRLILQARLRIGPKSVERAGRIAYIREPEEVARKIASGDFTIGFLQNPPDIDQVKRIALAGQCMPQKSTDFYPKLLSGLVAYDMMERRA